MQEMSRKAFRKRRKLLKSSISALVLSSLASSFLISLPSEVIAAPVTSTVVDVDFTTASRSGSTITNSATSKTADLTINGTPTFDGTGVSFPNTSSSHTTNYLTGNLGSTSNMSEITIEFSGKFPDNGCTSNNSGSMVFSIQSGSLIYYNIYRHSGFIGFNTFNSELYGIPLPDTTNFHSYKFVLRPYPDANTLQEIWVDGVKQSLDYRTSSTAPGCGTMSVSGENSPARRFKTGSGDNGNFYFMTHVFAPDTWGTTGTLANLKITTVTTPPALTVPGAPSIGSITAGNSQLSVPFTAPASDGGAAITDYKYSTDNGSTWTSAGTTSSPIVITGLTNGISYSVKLLAVNSVGDGTASAGVTATPAATVPGAPSIGSITAGNNQLTVPFTAPASNGGATITNYKYSTDNGSSWTSAGTTSSPIVITGLTNGTSYSVKLLAVNSAGDGTASTGVSATPSAPQAQQSPSSSPITPAPPAAKVESIEINKDPKTKGSVVKVKLAQPVSEASSEIKVRVKIFDAKGRILQELDIPVAQQASYITIPVKSSIGDFTVEASTLGPGGSSTAFSTNPGLATKPYFVKAKGLNFPKLVGTEAASPIYFAPNSSKLSFTAKKNLIALVESAVASSKRLAVTGFVASFNKGRIYELKVAKARALAVSKFIKANGYGPWVYYAGYGAISTGNINKDRRVELRLVD